MNSFRFSTQRDKQTSKPDQVGQFWSNKGLRWQINVNEFSLYKRADTPFSESEIEHLADKISNKLIRIVEEQLDIKPAMIKQGVQDKIDRIKKLAEESDSKSADNKERSSITREDSLAKIITTQKEADAFMADLETAIRIAHKKQN